MQDFNAPLDAGFEPCVHHLELDERHKTEQLVYSIPLSGPVDEYNVVARPIDPFCETFAETGSTDGVETVVTDDGRIQCRARAD